jgi:hypothetical protein
MPGSVLNTLNGFAVEAADVPRIVTFLRALDTAGVSDRSNAQAVHDVISRVRLGQPLGDEGVAAIRAAIRRYAEPPTR